MTMKKYKCASCGSMVFTTVDTLDKEERGLLLCQNCKEFEEALENPEYHVE